MLFSNAGISGAISKIVDYPSDVFHRTLAVHIGGAFHVLKHGLPRLSDGGSVIITSSVVGLMGFADLSGYIAAKHGQVGLMRAAAKEVRRATDPGQHPAPGPHLDRVPGRHRDDHDGRGPGRAAAAFDAAASAGTSHHPAGDRAGGALPGLGRQRHGHLDDVLASTPASRADRRQPRSGAAPACWVDVPVRPGTRLCRQDRPAHLP